MAELKIISMDEVQSKEVNWLWYPYIPYGKNHNHSGRSRRRKNDFGFKTGGASFKRRGASL